jgi:hypothetical protein
VEAPVPASVVGAEAGAGSLVADAVVSGTPAAAVVVTETPEGWSVAARLAGASNAAGMKASR